MSIFKNLAKPENVVEEKDTLGGGRLFDSGLVDFIIESAFITFADSGAMAFNAHLKEVSEAGRILRVQEWIASGDAKGNKNTYTKDGKEFYLPGYNIANAIAMLSADMELSSMTDDDISKKTIKLWSKEAKGEKPTEVDMITELVGKPITIGVLRQIVDKTVKNDEGTYVPDGTTREENTIGKVFHTETGFTVQELKAGATEDDTPEFRVKWAAANDGVTKDKSTKTAAGATGKPTVGAPVAKKTSLFANKQ